VRSKGLTTGTPTTLQRKDYGDGMRQFIHSARRWWWLGALVIAALIAARAELRAQHTASQAADEDAVVASAHASLTEAIGAGDKSAARKLLSLQFTFVDENGKVHERKEFLHDLKGVAAATGDSNAKTWGRVAVVSGHRKSAIGSNVFFVDLWARQKGKWRMLVMQDVVLADEVAAKPAAPSASAKPYVCDNPCQTIPYRVRSTAEQDIITSFQAVEKSVVTHDAGEWAKHIADEFMLYGTGRTPASKSERIAAMTSQKDSNTRVIVGEIETMRLSVYGDSAAMIASHATADNSRPAYRTVRVWVKRGGQWLMAISAQTDIKTP
jgi:hypothetical protein